MKSNTTFDQFDALDVRVGTVLKAQEFDGARKPAYQLWIEFGEEIGTLKTSAQITELYTPQSLVGTQVLAIVNFEDKQIANFRSQCLVLGVYSDDGVVLLRSDRPVKNGSKVG